MEEKEIRFSYRVVGNAAELQAEDWELLNTARKALNDSYSPYSGFKVGAAALLANGETVTGSNQENAAFPVGICAEGTLLSACSSLYPNVAVVKIAITASSQKHPVLHPVAPCGICRQRILEYETRFSSPIEIILAGETGDVYTVKTVKDLLPLHFSKSDL